jgi:hypothetical protein
LFNPHGELVLDTLCLTAMISGLLNMQANLPDFPANIKLSGQKCLLLKISRQKCPKSRVISRYSGKFACYSIVS